MDDNVNLFFPLKSGYGNKEAEAVLARQGYIVDPELSNHNEQVYFNANNKKLLYNITGTHNLSDWGTDIYLGVGKIKSTNRYHEAKSVYNKAQQKYSPAETTLTGHSLGGGLASVVKGRDDKVITYNAGYSPNTKPQKNVKNYRTSGDLVSMFAPNTIVLKNRNFFKSNIIAHEVNNLKHDIIYV